jgi:hypothetical protein
MAPRPNPPATPARPAAPEGAQRGRWITRFWEELTPTQRRLVAAGLRRGPLPRTASPGETQAAWDVMGLAEREALIAGRPASTAATGAAEAPSGRRAEAEGVTPHMTQ